jgi:hypothetical protein
LTCWRVVVDGLEHRARKSSDSSEAASATMEKSYSLWLLTRQLPGSKPRSWLTSCEVLGNGPTSVSLLSSPVGWEQQEDSTPTAQPWEEDVWAGTRYT